MRPSHEAHSGPQRPSGIVRRGWRTLFGASAGGYARSIALKAYRKKQRGVEPYRRWVEAVGEARIAGHYAHSLLTDPFALAHAKSQLYELISTLCTRMDAVGRGRSALDAGASDGLFLDLLGLRDGVGFNILDACVRKIRSEGVRACRGDLECLPFREGAFDTVICCQALEHLPNPIRALQELERVCRKRLFLTLPWVPDTRIKPRAQGDVESHIFEFSPPDFRKIISYTGLSIDYAQEIEVLPGVRNPFGNLILKRYLWRSYFPRLQYYELIPGR